MTQYNWGNIGVILGSIGVILGNVGVILGLYWGYLGVLQVLDWGCIGVKEFGPGSDRFLCILEPNCYWLCTWRLWERDLSGHSWGSVGACGFGV